LACYIYTVDVLVNYRLIGIFITLLKKMMILEVFC